MSGENCLNNEAWEKLFSKYNILGEIDRTGSFKISANQIKEFREPRLMAKFDHKKNLPGIFSENNLAILPITRGDYIISHFDAYHNFEKVDAEVKRVSLPSYIKSLNPSDIPSESIALNCAAASEIIADFLEDENLVSTVSGRMGSGTFSFDMLNKKLQSPFRVDVSSSQIEIDAAYEGKRCLAVIEAKHDLADDFLIRQLYYPFRLWQSRISKAVRPLFLIYSNGVYRLCEYIFTEVNNYNSLILVKQKNYIVEDNVIKLSDVERLIYKSPFSTGKYLMPEPPIPFPQADSFERVINICELLNQQDLSRSEVTERYDFDERQTNYYTDAARYLGLLDKEVLDRTPVYKLSNKGREILNLNYKQRQLAYCELILEHKAFYDTLCLYLRLGKMPPTNEIVRIMKESNLYNIRTENTFVRRSQTIKSWVNWIIKLINSN
jgi:hypothetical protein